MYLQQLCCRKCFRMVPVCHGCANPYGKKHEGQLVRSVSSITSFFTYINLIIISIVICIIVAHKHNISTFHFLAICRKFVSMDLIKRHSLSQVFYSSVAERGNGKWEGKWEWEMGKSKFKDESQAWLAGKVRQTPTSQTTDTSVWINS